MGILDRARIQFEEPMYGYIGKGQTNPLEGLKVGQDDGTKFWFYNKRGTAEQWIKEGKYALKWTQLSCHDFVDNQVRLQLFALACNLGNFLRRLALPKCMNKWSLRTLCEKLIEIGAKVVRHARYVVFQMAEVVVPKALFCEILERIGRLNRQGFGNDPNNSGRIMCCSA